MDEAQGRGNVSGDEIQGKTEQRTEPYSKYGEGAVTGLNAVARSND